MRATQAGGELSDDSFLLGAIVFNMCELGCKKIVVFFLEDSTDKFYLFEIFDLNDEIVEKFVLIYL